MRLGEHDTENKNESQHIELKAVNFTVHPNRTARSDYHDIVLIELESKVDFNYAIRPACLPEDLTLPVKSTATGWGYVKQGQRSSILMKVSVDILSHDKCKEIYQSTSTMMQGIRETYQFCAGSRMDKNNTCSGDSGQLSIADGNYKNEKDNLNEFFFLAGGPLQVFHTDYFCTYTIVGVTSRGRDCFNFISQSSGIYTKVFPYLDWIESVVWPSEQ